MSNGISELLREYGTGLGELRELMPQLEQEMKKQKETRLALPQVPEFFTPEQVKGLGFTTETGEPFELETGWLLKLTPSGNGVEPTISFITPEKWEFTQMGEYISPEGKKFTREELETQLETPEIPLEIEDVFGRAFGLKGYVAGAPQVKDLLAWAEKEPEEFLKTIRTLGRNEDTEELLVKAFGVTPEEMAEIFPAPLGKIEAAKAGLGEAWRELTVGEFKWGELGKTIMGALGVAGEYLDKYIIVPWSGSVSVAFASAERDREVTDIKLLTRINELDKKYGWKALYTDEFAEAYHEWEAPIWGLKGTTEILNPAFFIPYGGAAGLVARIFSKVPVLGKTLGVAAKVVQTAEAPWAAGKVWTPKVERFLIKELPTSAQLDDFLFKSDTYTRIARKIPFAKKVVPGAVAEEIPASITTTAQMQNAVTREIRKMREILGIGEGTRGQTLAYLRELGSTAEILGVKDAMCNPKLVRPRLPGGSLALGDVVQAPEMYIFKNKSGLEYCKRAQQLCREAYESATKEGIDINRVGLEPFEEYVHWVCTGKIGKDGVLEMGRGGTRAVGGIVSSMKTRRFESMMDGIKAGYKYSDDLEVYVATYVDDIFKTIADRRLGTGLSSIVTKIEGMTPSGLEATVTTLAQAQALKKVSGSLAGIVDDKAFRRALGEGTEFWDEAIYNQLKAGKSITVYRAAPLGEKEIYLGSRVTHSERSVKAIYDEMYLPKEAHILKTIATADDLIYQMPGEFILVKLTAPIKVAIPKLEGVLPTRPLERLAALYPERAMAWGGIKKEVADLGYIWSGVKRMARGERLPAVTMSAIEKRSPELAKRLTEISKLPISEQKTALTLLSKELKTQITELKPEWWKARYARKEAMEIVRKPILGREEGYIRTVTGYAHPMFAGQVYPRAIADQATKLLNEQVNGFLKATSGISSALVLQTAALDISAWCIQGFIAQFSNPLRAMRTNLKMIEALIMPKTFQRYLVKNAISMNERLYYLGAQRPFEYFEAMTIIGKPLAKLPAGKFILGQTYGRAQASFSAWATVYKDLMWQGGAKNWIKRGQGAEFARYLDRMTGSMSFAQLGMPANMRAFLKGWVAFAPQYRFSVLSWFSYLFKGGMTGWQAKRDLAKMVAGATVAYVGFCKTTDNPIYLDPFKDGKKFMSINVDGHWIGLGGAVVSMVRAFVDIGASALSVGENEPMDFLTLDKWKNPLLRAWFMQSAPLPRIISEIAQRKDFLGYELETPEDWALWAAEQVTPIWLQDILFDKGGVPFTVMSILGNFAGLRTSPQTRWETLDERIRALKAIDSIPNLTPEQRKRIEEGEPILQVLDKFQKAHLFNAFPELIPFYEDSVADAMKRSSATQKNYEASITNIRNEALEDMGKAKDIGISLDKKDTRWLRDRYADIMATYGAKNDILREVPEYQEMFEGWDEARLKRLPDAEAFDIAYWEYIESVVAPDFETSAGEYDFDAYQVALDTWKVRWGDDFYEKVLYVLENNKADYPDWAIKLWKDRFALNKGNYWNLLPAVTGMSEADWAIGERITQNPQYYSLWKQYQTLPDVDKEAFLTAHPELTKDQRAEYRKSNPEDDARLALWGYGGKLQSIEAYNLVEQWSKELGIPLEQMGLGLPPRTLIQPYFDYADVTRQFSGNSAEAKLFRLENPEWDTWGQENWGWKPVEDNLNVLKLSVKWRDMDNQYGAIESTEDRRAFLKSNPAYADDRRRRDAYGLGFSGAVVKSSQRAWLESTIRDLSGAVGILTDKGLDQTTLANALNALTDISNGIFLSDSERKNLITITRQAVDEFLKDTTLSPSERDKIAGALAEAHDFLEDLPQMSQDKLLITEVPERVDLIEIYVEYYKIPAKSEDDWYADPANKGEPYYEDDWFLMEHPEFYKAMYELGIWTEPKDFTKVPTREVYRLYRTYISPLMGRQDRLNFRKQHPELDAWLVIAKGLKPISERGKKEAEKTAWEKLEEKRRMLEWLKGLK